MRHSMAVRKDGGKDVGRKTAGNKPPPYKILQELHQKKSVRHNKKDRTQRYGLKNQ